MAAPVSSPVSGSMGMTLWLLDDECGRSQTTRVQVEVGSLVTAGAVHGVLPPGRDVLEDGARPSLLHRQTTVSDSQPSSSRALADRRVGRDIPQADRRDAAVVRPVRGDDEPGMVAEAIGWPIRPSAIGVVIDGSSSMRQRLTAALSRCAKLRNSPEPGMTTEFCVQSERFGYSRPVGSPVAIVRSTIVPVPSLQSIVPLSVSSASTHAVSARCQSTSPVSASMRAKPEVSRDQQSALAVLEDEGLRVAPRNGDATDGEQGDRVVARPPRLRRRAAGVRRRPSRCRSARPYHAAVVVGRHLDVFVNRAGVGVDRDQVAGDRVDVEEPVAVLRDAPGRCPPEGPSAASPRAPRPS